MLAAGPLGLAVAAAAWIALGGPNALSGSLDALDARLAADVPPPAPLRARDSFATQAMATPLFALTTGPGAVADVTVQLDGVAISPRSTAALVGVAGKPADWLQLGATRDGVTLMEVHPDKIVVDTAVGFKSVALGGGTPAGNFAPANGDAIPAGVRLPPAPASAPGVH